MIYTTQPRWSEVEEVDAHGNTGARRSWPLDGIIRLRTGDLQQELVFTEPVGVRTQRQTRSGAWAPDYRRSTSRPATLKPLIHHLMAAGPVLVVTSTRREAQRFAREIARNLEVHDPAARITELLSSRLGGEHPIIDAVRRGIAYHHAALPVDVQAELEAEVRAGNIKCLVATTTLTEGINLPFRSVVIASRSYPGPDGNVEVIDSKRLLNAIGRAGRAGRETEGWLVLADPRRADELELESLEVTAADFRLSSRLATELDSLSAIEELLAAGADASFGELAEIADGFLAYIWFVAEALHEVYGTDELDHILEFVRGTLAWRQLDGPSRRLIELAGANAYRLRRSFSPVVRQRWIRAGTSFATAQTLDKLSPTIADFIEESDGLSDAEILDRVISRDMLDSVLSLRETRWRGFRLRPNTPRKDRLPVDTRAMVIDWVSGLELVDLAEKHLASVEDEGWRLDQLSDFVSAVLEHALPWSLGTLTTWVNSDLEARDSEKRLPEHLAGLVRFGVPNTVALELMLEGVWSRRLSNTVSQTYLEVATPTYDNPRSWLCSLDLSEWRRRFNASPTELRDLVAYVRQPGADAIARILDGETLEVPIDTDQLLPMGTEVELSRAAKDEDPARLAVIHGDMTIGFVPPALQSDLEFLVDSGLRLSVSAQNSSSGVQLTLSLQLARPTSGSR